MKRLQTIAPAGLILAIAVWVAFVSFTQSPADAFVFPRLVSTVFVALAAWVLFTTLIGEYDDASVITAAQWKNFLPGLIIGAIYVFWVAKGLGFYTGSALAAFALITFYDPHPHSALSSWMRRAVITLAFIAVMYLLFSILLGVFTPREVLFR